MGLRGKFSTAHEYNLRGECIHCGMYKVNVERMSHVCTPAREAAQDIIEATGKVVKKIWGNKNGK